MVGAEALRERGLEALLGARELVLEIGFGRAELLLELALAAPARVFLGCDISRKRVEKAARRAERRALANAFFVHAPAEHLIERILPPGSVAECWINCPDPWPKKRHWRRRLLQRPFLERLAPVLSPGASLHVSTDHPGYRDWIAEAFACSPELENLSAPEPWLRAGPLRIETAYEAKWRADGREIAYFEYRKRP